MEGEDLKGQWERTKHGNDYDTTSYFSKNIIGAFARTANVVGVGRSSLEEMKFQAMHNEEVNFLSNEGGAYRQNTLDKIEIKVGV